MATYAIGDVQGCYDELQQLLELIQFDKKNDKLWFVGDLINRGPKSLEVLRFVKSLGKSAKLVLGNHDLHTLAVAAGFRRYHRNDSIDDILDAHDRKELLKWLRHQPLMHYSKKHNIAMLHAGLPPEWDIAYARKRAKEVEAVLQSKSHKKFLKSMYGNKPRKWKKNLHGMQRLRFITNCFTRLRYCDNKGHLGLEQKGKPGSQRKPFKPWFKIKSRASRDDQIVFGHWSTLGLTTTHNVFAIDTGCLWGGRLTALRIEDKAIFSLDCPGCQKPGKA